MFGIDFGTSNTIVAYDGGSETRVLRFGNVATVPSVMFVARSGEFSIGNTALDDYANALRTHRADPDFTYKFRFFRGLKLVLRDESFKETLLFGKRTSVEELIGMYLRQLKQEAEAITGDYSTEAVFGWPTDLDAVTERVVMARFKRSCDYAGYKTVQFVYEPVAALIDSIHELSGTCMIFDFGGGTLDLTVADVVSGQVNVRSIVGKRLGGYMLNEDVARHRIVKHFSSELERYNRTNLPMPDTITTQVTSFYALPMQEIATVRKSIFSVLNMAVDKDRIRALLAFVDRGLFQPFYQEIDRAKIELSSQLKTVVDFAVDPYLDFEEQISRTDFEAIIQPRLDEISVLIETALANARVEPKDIDYLFLVGGSSQIPVVRRLLDTIFPGKSRDGDFFSSIASGLIKAHIMGFDIKH